MTTTAERTIEKQTTSLRLQKLQHLPEHDRDVVFAHLFLDPRSPIPDPRSVSGKSAARTARTSSRLQSAPAGSAPDSRSRPCRWHPPASPDRRVRLLP